MRQVSVALCKVCFSIRDLRGKRLERYISDQVTADDEQVILQNYRIKILLVKKTENNNANLQNKVLNHEQMSTTIDSSKKSQYLFYY